MKKLKKIKKLPKFCNDKLVVFYLTVKLLSKLFIKRLFNSNSTFSISRICEPLALTGHCFAAQTEYFRSNYYDMLIDEGNYEYNVDLSKESLPRLKKFCIENKIKYLWLFRPERFLQIKDDLIELKKLGVIILGFSTEPMPTLKDFLSFRSHVDQVKRLESLIPAKELNLDKLIHFDSSSMGLLNFFKVENLVTYPLPVSRQIFERKQSEYKYDICFIGRYTDYREFYLAPLKTRYRVLHIAHGLFDEEAADLMSQSKVVLNLHNLNYLNFEDRVVQVKLTKSLLVSQKLTMDNWLKHDEYVVFKHRGDLVNKIDWILKNFDSKEVDTLKSKFENSRSFEYSHLVSLIHTL